MVPPSRLHHQASSGPGPTSLTSARPLQAPVGPERFGINLERRDNQLSPSGKYKNTQSYCKDTEKRSFQKTSCLVRAFFLLCIKMSRGGVHAREYSPATNSVLLHFPQARYYETVITKGYSINWIRFI